MHDLAYHDLHALEANHWWYRGMRAIYSRLLRRHIRAETVSVLDIGCGSGGNFPVLAPYGSVVGLDLASVALELWPEGAAGLVQANAVALPFDNSSFDLVTLLALVEHVDNDVGVLREAARVCKPEGIVMVNVPAFQALWTDHDEANRHVRRYRAGELERKARKAGLGIVTMSYANAFLFPIALVTRSIQRVQQRMVRQGTPRVDMFPVPEPLNSWLACLLDLEGLLMNWIRFPFGVSIVAVLTPEIDKDRRRGPHG
jgi:ubiquinone/menaquinone biosynthesis C-methylase UbiE